MYSLSIQCKTSESYIGLYISVKNDGTSARFLFRLICLFVLYAFGSCRSQCNQTLHSLLFRLGEGRGLFFDSKFWPPEYLVTSLLESYSKHSIRRVRACDYFLKGDKDPQFSPFDTRDFEGMTVCSTLIGR